MPLHLSAFLPCAVTEIGIDGRNFDPEDREFVRCFEAGETSQVLDKCLEELLLDSVSSFHQEEMANHFDVLSFVVYVHVTKIEN